MLRVLSVNVGIPRPSRHTSVGQTGIDKRPVDEPVEVRAPGSKATGLGSGLVGDAVCDRRHHGGDYQAVYAYAREDMDWWAEKLGRPLESGCFGENLTTVGMDLTESRIGERWRIGTALLEIAGPRIPCRTFAGWLGEVGWIKTFTRENRAGAYLRVIEPGTLRRGDALTVASRPDHDVTIGVVFRALTLEPDLLPRLIGVDGLDPDAAELARRCKTATLDDA
jgi:MOSC domain-containing protein YiiM